MVKLKVVPLPTPSDSTLTVPPDRSTIYLTIVKPKPMPSLLISAVRYNLPKRVKSLGKSYFAMPVPVSRTCTDKYFSSSSTPGFREAMISINPCFVNFIALRMRLIKTYFNRRSSPIKRGTRFEQELRSSRSSLSPYTSILSVTCESWSYGEKIQPMLRMTFIKSNALHSSSKFSNFSWRKSSRSLTKDCMNSA